MIEHPLRTIYSQLPLSLRREEMTLIEKDTFKTLLGFELDELENTRYNLYKQLNEIRRLLFRVNARVEHVRLEVEELDIKDLTELDETENQGDVT